MPRKPTLTTRPRGTTCHRTGARAAEPPHDRSRHAHSGRSGLQPRHDVRGTGSRLGRAEELGPRLHSRPPGQGLALPGAASLLPRAGGLRPHARERSHPRRTGDARRPGGAARGNGPAGIPRRAGRRSPDLCRRGRKRSRRRIRRAVEHPPHAAGHRGRQGAAGRAPRGGARVVSAPAEHKTKPSWSIGSWRSTTRSRRRESRPMFAAAGSGLRSRRPFTIRPANRWRRLRSSARRSKCSPASRS